MVRNCAPENLEIPDAQLRICGLVLTHHPGMTAEGSARRWPSLRGASATKQSRLSPRH